MSKPLRCCLLRLLEAVLAPRSMIDAPRVIAANGQALVRAGAVQLAVDLVAGTGTDLMRLLSCILTLAFLAWKACLLFLYENSVAMQQLCVESYLQLEATHLLGVGKDINRRVWNCDTFSISIPWLTLDVIGCCSGMQSLSIDKVFLSCLLPIQSSPCLQLSACGLPPQNPL